MQLVDEGHEVKIYNFKLLYPNFLFPGKSQTDDRPKPDLNIVRTIHSLNPFSWWKTGKLIRQEKPDIAVVPFWLPFFGPCLGSIAKRIRKNNHTKVICLAHNIIPHEKRIGDKPFTKRFAKRMQGFLVLSKSVGEDVRQFSNAPVRWNPHPVYDHFGERISRNEALAALNLPEENRYILFFGFVRKYKGLDLLLKAFQDERFRKKNIHLLVAGEFYTSKEEYHALVTPEMKDQVHWFSEFIPDNQVNRYFCAADLIVQPYKTATQSGVTQIAYNFHKPMVVTNVGGLQEIVPDGKAGYVVEPEPAPIAEAIADFYDNNRASQLEAGVAKELPRFLWPAMTKALFELADEVSQV